MPAIALSIVYVGADNLTVRGGRDVRAWIAFAFGLIHGFGFANVWGSTEDVFVHIEVLRRSGFADLAPGEAVGLRVIEGRRGRMAIEVVSWDAQARQAGE